MSYSLSFSFQSLNPDNAGVPSLETRTLDGATLKRSPRVPRFRTPRIRIRASLDSMFLIPREALSSRRLEPNVRALARSHPYDGNPNPVSPFFGASVSTGPWRSNRHQFSRPIVNKLRSNCHHGDCQMQSLDSLGEGTHP